MYSFWWANFALDMYINTAWLSVCVCAQCVVVTWHKVVSSWRMASICAHWTTKGCMEHAAMAVGTLLKERWWRPSGRPTTPPASSAPSASELTLGIHIQTSPAYAWTLIISTANFTTTSIINSCTDTHTSHNYLHIISWSNTHSDVTLADRKTLSSSCYQLKCKLNCKDWHHSLNESSQNSDLELLLT